MPKPSDLTPKQRHDIDRQERAHLVRLSEDEQAKAQRLLDGEAKTIPALLRRLLNAAPERRRAK